MSVLIDTNGKVFADENTINKILSPVQLGKFEISNAAKQFIANKMNSDNVHQLFKFIPKNMHEFCLNKKLIQTKASIFKSQEQEHLC